MDNWKLIRGPAGRAYRRALGQMEQCFYWDGQFAGTADTLQHIILRVDPATSNLENISRAWCVTKQRHPLLAARIEEHTYQEQDFVVEEQRLSSSLPGEISFDSVSSTDEAHEYADRIINGPRQITNDTLARLQVLRRTDDARAVHLLIQVAHLITDGMGNLALLRTLLEALSKPDIDVGSLEDRLWLARSSDAVKADKSQSVAKQRWHRIMGIVLVELRMAKHTGGHTLPRKVSAATPLTPARSRYLHTTFTPSESKKIIQSCREQRVTFGNAYHVLGQVAMTRVLHRLYLARQISPEEWFFRQREPFMPGGPLNQRPFLDPEWYSCGGASTVNLAISFFYNRLPAIPGGTRPGVEGQVPSHNQLLSRARFFYRARIMKAQANAFLRHPRHVDIHFARMPKRIESVAAHVEKWRALQRSDTSIGLSTQPISATEQAKGPNFVMAFGGSSMGSLESLLPLAYPPKSPQPTIEVMASHTRLRTRPMELYLGAATFRGELNLYVHYDGNVYEDALVREWLDEIRSAVRWYLDGVDHGQDGIMAKL